MLAVIVGLVMAALGWPVYGAISPLAGVAFFLLGVISVHLVFSNRFILPFPHVALYIAILQYVIAPLLSQRYPPSNPLFEIQPSLPEYLKFAVFAVLASSVGWALAMVRLRQDNPPPIQASAELLSGLDALIFAGVIGGVAGHFPGMGGLGFFFLLIGKLRYVGVLGRMLCRAPGWPWRLGLVFFMEVLNSTGETMFHDLILWSVWTFALWGIIFKPAWWKIGLALVLATLLLPPLQESKWQIRNGLEDFSGASESGNRVTRWLGYLGKDFVQEVTGDFDAEAWGDTIARYNQGWIISRVMQHVPEVEPYARGETIKDALIAAAFPRFIMANKVIAGGKANMARFAGMELNENTSMNLGYAGEMYANFGYWGGILGCGCYALLLAAVFRWFYSKALTAPLWWCVLPYVAFPALKAEEGLAEVINWIAKAAIVMVLVMLAFPAFRKSLFPAIGLPSMPRKRRRPKPTGMA